MYYNFLYIIQKNVSLWYIVEKYFAIHGSEPTQSLFQQQTTEEINVVSFYPFPFSICDLFFLDGNRKTLQGI